MACTSILSVLNVTATDDACLANRRPAPNAIRRTTFMEGCCLIAVSVIASSSGKILSSITHRRGSRFEVSTERLSVRNATATTSCRDSVQTVIAAMVLKRLIMGRRCRPRLWIVASAIIRFLLCGRPTICQTVGQSTVFY